VSERFMVGIACKLAELMGRELSWLKLAVLGDRRGHFAERRSESPFHVDTVKSNMLVADGLGCTVSSSAEPGQTTRIPPPNLHIMAASLERYVVARTVSEEGKLRSVEFGQEHS
jgi:hypothetical protein